MSKKKGKIWTVVLIAALIIAFLCIAIVVFKMFSAESEQKNYESVASTYASEQDGTITSPTIDEELADNPIDFDSLQKENDEIYSWIYFPDTNINYPVCQSKSDDNFYLDRDIYGNYSIAGAIYSQSCNSTDYSDPVTVLYGHNMANGSMFANLHKFEDSDFFSSHEYFYIYTPQHKLTYKIVSAYVYDDRHIMNSFDFSDTSVFEEYLDYILNPRSLYKNVREGTELSSSDRIVTLSTCLDVGEGRYLVQGVLEKDELTK